MEFLRDLTEDTGNSIQAIQVYYQLGKLFEYFKEYDKAVLMFKKILQIAWFENLQAEEILAY